MARRMRTRSWRWAEEQTSRGASLRNAVEVEPFRFREDRRRGSRAWATSAGAHQSRQHAYSTAKTFHRRFGCRLHCVCRPRWRWQP